MKDLSNNTKFHLANLKTISSDKRRAFGLLSDEVKKELIEKKYWDEFYKILTEKAFGNYSEWFDSEYCGSRKEKSDYDYTSRK